MSGLPKNWVTLYTDASHKDRLCSYAFVARAEWGWHRMARVCPPEVAGVDDAEMYAMFQGVHHCMRHWHDRGIQGFYIRTDSLNGMNIFLKNSSPKSDPQERILHAFWDLVRQKHKLHVNFKHVRGHNKDQHRIRRYMNDMVDQMAGEIRRLHEQRNR